MANIKNVLHTPLALSQRRADVIENAFGVAIAETVSVDHAMPFIRAANHHDEMVALLLEYATPGTPCGADTINRTRVLLTRLGYDMRTDFEKERDASIAKAEG